MKKVPFLPIHLGSSSNIVPAYSPRLEQAPRSPYKVDNEIVDISRLSEIKSGLTREIYPPELWALIRKADTFVLGRGGIRPRFNDPEATEAWNNYRPNAAQNLTVREVCRQIVTSLVVDNEVFLFLDTGTVTPVPAPYHINYDRLGNPVSYQRN